MSSVPDHASDTSEEVETHNNLFSEPEGYFPPTPPPTTQTYTLLSSSSPSPRTITLHLVGYSPTEAHHLWNGSRVISEYFETHPHEVRDKTVLELGAGAGLPSLVSAVLGARRVVMTDYPDVEIVQTMWRNIDECEWLPRKEPSSSAAAAAAAAAVSGSKAPAPAPFTEKSEKGNGAVGRNADGQQQQQQQEGEEDQDVILAKGFIWGADPTPLLSSLPPPPSPAAAAGADTNPDAIKFDVLILADLLFRHTEHGHLLDTIRDTMAPRGKAFVFFTSYRPWLQHKDLAFFDLARERGFVVDKLLERKMERPMFENDPGDEEVRKTCTGWVVSWPSDRQ